MSIFGHDIEELPAAVSFILRSPPEPDEDAHLCRECKIIDLEAVLEHIAGLGQAEAGDIVVQHRIGLNAECKLCKLLLRFVLPGTYSQCPEPGSTTPWQLRAFSIRSMLVDSRTQSLFCPAPLALLHAGDGERDYVKAANSEEAEQIGFLAFGRTQELKRTGSLGMESGRGNVDHTDFISETYDPEMVKRWLQYREEPDRDDNSEYSSDAEGSDTECCTDDEWEQVNVDEHDGTSQFEELDRESTTEEKSAASIDQSLRQDFETVEYTEIEGMRVIDCQTLEVIARTRDMSYVTLSYVWVLAHQDMVCLHGVAAEPLSPRSDSSLPAIIPRVVHNSIQVTRDLGYNYLWVDQFCINQAAPLEKKAEQILQMDLIYSCAELTIVAASTSGALPGVGSTPRFDNICWTMDHSDDKLSGPGRQMTIFSTPPVPYNEIKRQVWYSRGWCFQEALLSPRRLYFTDHQMLFESGDIHCCDAYPSPFFNLTNTFDEDVLDNPSLAWPTSWEDRLEQVGSEYQYDLEDPRGRFQTELHICFQLLKVYTAKDLTMASDAIYAFAGAFKVFSRNDPCFQVLAGIPIFDARQCVSSYPEHSLEQFVEFQEDRFVFALSWSHVNKPARRPDFPSWSWAGWEGQACWDAEEHDFVPATRLHLKAIVDMDGTTSDLPGISILNRPRAIIGEGVVIPGNFFVWDHIWKKMPRSLEDTLQTWRAAAIYVGDWPPIDYTAEEEEMARRLKHGVCSCILLGEYLAPDSDIARMRLLVVEWQKDERELLDGFLGRNCCRVGSFELYRGWRGHALTRREDVLHDFPRVGFYMT